MELLILFAIFAAIGLISWLYEQIQEYYERQKSKQRDEIAKSTIATYGLTSEGMTETKHFVEYVKSCLHLSPQSSTAYTIKTPNVTPRIADNLCPTCGLGLLVRRRGKHGTFLGCTRYPACKTAKPLSWVNQRAKAEIKQAKEDQKEQYGKMFMDDLKRAYK